MDKSGAGWVETKGGSRTEERRVRWVFGGTADLMVWDCEVESDGEKGWLNWGGLLLFESKGLILFLAARWVTDVAEEEYLLFLFVRWCSC